MSKITVVIPLYNKEKYIARAINSVLAQTFQDFEIVVVNDGSTDNGPKIVENIKDSRIRLINQINKGASFARNRGVEESKSDLIAFLDADDEYLPMFMERAVGFVAAHPSVSTVFTNRTIIKDNTPWLVCPFSTARMLENYFDFAVQNGGRGMTSSSIVVQKNIFRDVGGFPLGINRGEDTDTFIRLVMAGEVGCMPEVLSVFHTEASDSDTLYPQPPFPAAVKTMRQFRAENRIPCRFAKSILTLENLYLLQYSKELADYGDWSGAMRVLYQECQIRHCPKKRFAKIQCRLILKWLLQKWRP